VFLEFDPHLLVSDLNFPTGESGGGHGAVESPLTATRCCRC
jgi:hypothetical protein